MLPAQPTIYQLPERCIGMVKPRCCFDCCCTRGDPTQAQLYSLYCHSLYSLYCHSSWRGLPEDGPMVVGA
jgi:hypothetical protein